MTLYAGLLDLGSDLSAAEPVRMVPALAAAGPGQMVLRIEAAGRLRAANDAVLRFYAQTPDRRSLGARPVRFGRHDEP